MLTFFQAIVMGLLQGVTELFPVSSLGHSVIIPSLIPGWDGLAKAQSRPESFFLALLVALHVGTAIALVVFYRRDWYGIIRGFGRTLRDRRIGDADGRLSWLIIVASIPAGLTGLAFEHVLRVIFAKPLYASIFLMVNGAILGAGERVRRRAEVKEVAIAHGTYEGTDVRRLETLEFREAAIIGVAQTAALFAGISRSGITMVAGLVRGLNHADAARFSFLLATPIILAAGVYKLPDLMGPLGKHIRVEALVGTVAAAVAAYFAVRFLTRYFRTRTLTPFAVYCALAGAAMTVYFGFFH